MSRTSTQRILKDHLKFQAYGKKVQPKISEDQMGTCKLDTLRTFVKRTLSFLFSSENMFDIDGIYNCQNERESEHQVVLKLMQEMASR